LPKPHCSNRGLCWRDHYFLRKRLLMAMEAPSPRSLADG
jgi:hypothetical protein